MDVKDVLKKGLLVLELKLERCDALIPKKDTVMVPRVMLERFDLSSASKANTEPSTIQEPESNSSTTQEPNSNVSTTQEKASSDDVCWGCLEEGDLKDMHVPFGEHENTYADLVTYCFSLQVIEDVKSSMRKFYICGSCIARLQEAVKFKRQLEIAQSFFNKLFLAEGEDPKYQTEAVPSDLRAHTTPHPMNTVLEICDDDIVEIIDDDDDVNSQFYNNSLLQSDQPTVMSNGICRSDFKECDKYDTSVIHTTPLCKALDEIKSDSYVCPFCKQTFVSLILRRLHLRTIHGATLAKFTCEECGQAYKLCSHLSAHVRNVHLLVRPFHCHKCNLGFFRKEGLTNHMYKHTKEKSFKCDGCHELFGTSSVMRKHRKTCPRFNSISDNHPDHFNTDDFFHSIPISHSSEFPYVPGMMSAFINPQDFQVEYEKSLENMETI